ncbi:MAG: hypothetical protein A2Z28_08310 [Chloroflexi bacterium RBG_16_51_9]|nr:MAG: hypothetical protein A2Z28_08310 [Chloroflexi bacterium RBG_16_51_9]
MNSLFTSVKSAATSKVWRLFLFLIVLIPALAQPALAQTKITDLNLWLRDGQNNYNNEAKAGQDNKFFLDVRNTGTEVITNIKLSVEPPEGWTIEIKPSEIASLMSGSLYTVDVNIKPVGKATKEGREVIFTAQSNEIQNVKSSFFVTVKPAQFWIWVWIAAGVLVVAGFVLIYMRFGRQ